MDANSFEETCTHLQINYLETLQDLVFQDLITNSLYRELTEKGKKEVYKLFKISEGQLGNRPSAFYSPMLEETLEETFKLRLGSPEIFRMDDFILEYAALLWISSDHNQKERIRAYASKHCLPVNGPLALGAIHVVQKGIEQKLLEVNPEDRPRDGKCYLKYLI